MLELDDYRKSRFYREALQDGKAEEKAEILHRMASNGFDPKQIAVAVGVDIKIVKKILKSQSS